MKQNTVWPKVSVMVITYNQRHLIDETLESVLTQNYQNFEIIVADDGSTDGSREVILEYQRRYPNIVVPILNERNLGITGNSNAAFFACSGELIAILGGDDLFLPDKLRAQAQQFIDNPQVVLSYHPVEIFQSQTNKTLFVSHQLARENIHNIVVQQIATNIYFKAKRGNASDILAYSVMFQILAFSIFYDMFFLLPTLMQLLITKIMAGYLYSHKQTPSRKISTHLHQ